MVVVVNLGFGVEPVWRLTILAIVIATVIVGGYAGYRQFSAARHPEFAKSPPTTAALPDVSVAARPSDPLPSSIAAGERASPPLADSRSRDVMTRFDAQREMMVRSQAEAQPADRRSRDVVATFDGQREISARFQDQSGRIVAASPQRPEYFFPWPPPRSSSQMTYPHALSNKPYNFKTLGDVADHIDAAVMAGGIEQTS